MPDSVRVAQTFLENVSAGEYAKAVENFDPTMKAALNDQVLAQMWEKMTQVFGKPLKHTGTRTARTLSSAADVVYLSWDFEKERIDARFIITSANQIAGISFETPVIK